MIYLSPLLLKSLPIGKNNYIHSQRSLLGIRVILVNFSSGLISVVRQEKTCLRKDMFETLKVSHCFPFLVDGYVGYKKILSVL